VRCCPNRPLFSSLLGAIAFVEAKSGDFHDAEQHFDEALKMLRENGFVHSDLSLLLMTQYASVLRKLQKRGEAKQLEAQAKAFRSATRPPR
jgi:Tetratricopeptide repeat